MNIALEQTTIDPEVHQADCNRMPSLRYLHYELRSHGSDAEHLNTVIDARTHEVVICEHGVVVVLFARPIRAGRVRRRAEEVSIILLDSI